MPEVSRFFGVIITMNYGDHPPPHFHASYGRHKALIAIRPSALLKGYLPPRVLGLVMEWAALHPKELADNWELARQQAEIAKIDPLE